MKTALSYLQVTLENGDVDFGGVDYFGETLQEFLDEAGMDYNTPMEIVNTLLINNGILPI